MSALIVCPLSHLAQTFEESGAQDVVTLMTRGTLDLPRLAPKRHLWLELSDIAAARDGYVLPAADRIEALLRFAEGWDRQLPLLLHCYAGVSRSTAAAYLVACALQPDRDEASLATELRCLSPSATPNPLMISLADGLLRRSGRMVRAIAEIGRGAECFEGTVFSLDIAPGRWTPPMP